MIKGKESTKIRKKKKSTEKTVNYNAIFKWHWSQKEYAFQENVALQISLEYL